MGILTCFFMSTTYTCNASKEAELLRFHYYHSLWERGNKMVRLSVRHECGRNMPFKQNSSSLYAVW